MFEIQHPSSSSRQGLDNIATTLDEDAASSYHRRLSSPESDSSSESAVILTPAPSPPQLPISMAMNSAAMGERRSSISPSDEQSYTMVPHHGADTVAGSSSTSEGSLGLPIPPPPPSSRVPTGQDWANYRSIFTELYRRQGKTLRETREIMEEQYDFHATERMYKKRIAEWGLKKYSTRNKSHSHSPDALAEDHAPTQRRTRRGRPRSADHGSVSSTSSEQALVPANRATVEKALENYFRARYPTIDYGQYLTMSEGLKKVEIIISQVDNYFQSYDADMWTRKFPQTQGRGVIVESPFCLDASLVAVGESSAQNAHPSLLFSRFNTAVELLKLESPKAREVAWKILAKAFEMVQDVVQQQHPQLLRYFFSMYWDSMFDAHPEIRKKLMTHIADFSEMHLNANHPITQVARLLPNVEDATRVSELGWKRMITTFDSLIGVDSYENLRCKMFASATYVSHKQYDEANRVLWHLVNCFDEESTAYYKRAALLRIGWVHTLQEEYKEAEPIFVDVLKQCDRWCGEQPDPLIFDDVYLGATTQLARLRARRSYEEGHALLEGILARCLATRGPDHAWTFGIKTEIENLTRVVEATELLEYFIVDA